MQINCDDLYARLLKYAVKIIENRFAGNRMDTFEVYGHDPRKGTFIEKKRRK